MLTYRIDNNIDQICIDWYNQLSEFYYYPKLHWYGMCCVCFFSCIVTDAREIACSFVLVYFYSNTITHIYLSLSLVLCTYVYTVHLFGMRRFRFASMNNRFFMSLFPLIIHVIYIHVSYTRALDGENIDVAEIRQKIGRMW